MGTEAKYVVRLTTEERAFLMALVGKGRAACTCPATFAPTQIPRKARYQRRLYHPLAHVGENLFPRRISGIKSNLSADFSAPKAPQIADSRRREKRESAETLIPETA